MTDLSSLRAQIEALLKKWADRIVEHRKDIENDRAYEVHICRDELLAIVVGVPAQQALVEKGIELADKAALRGDYADAEGFLNAAKEFRGAALSLHQETPTILRDYVAGQIERIDLDAMAISDGIFWKDNVHDIRDACAEVIKHLAESAGLVPVSPQEEETNDDQARMDKGGLIDHQGTASESRDGSD